MSDSKNQICSHQRKDSFYWRDKRESHRWVGGIIDRQHINRRLMQYPGGTSIFIPEDLKSPASNTARGKFHYHQKNKLPAVNSP